MAGQTFPGDSAGQRIRYSITSIRRSGVFIWLDSFGYSAFERSVVLSVDAILSTNLHILYFLPSMCIRRPESLANVKRTAWS